MVKNLHPLAIDAELEMEEELAELTSIDRSSYFYKFRSLDSAGFTLKLLETCQLWCSHFKSFNDVFELRFQYDRHPEKTDKIFEQWRHDFPQYRDTLSRKMVPIYGIEIIKSLLDDVGVSCFTKDALNPLMWSYYADSHRGICLAFEFKDTDKGHIESRSIHEVQYSVEPLEFDILVLEDRKAIPNKMIPFVTTKHQIWKHEAEWRYVGLQHAKTAVPFRKEALKEIIFGANVSEEGKTEVKRVCEANGLTPRYMTAQLNSWSYSLSFRSHG